MKASKEIRLWINSLRKRFGAKNGVIPAFAFDNPAMERKIANGWARRAREIEGRVGK